MKLDVSMLAATPEEIGEKYGAEFDKYADLYLKKGNPTTSDKAMSREAFIQFGKNVFFELEK